MPPLPPAPLLWSMDIAATGFAVVTVCCCCCLLRVGGGLLLLLLLMVGFYSQPSRAYMSQVNAATSCWVLSSVCSAELWSEKAY